MGKDKQKFQCKNCEKWFSIDKLYRVNLPKDIQKFYIKCSHCKKTITSYYSDKEIRKLQSRQKVLLKDNTLKMDTVKKLEEFGNNKKLIYEKMEALRKNLEGEK